MTAGTPEAERTAARLPATPLAPTHARELVAGALRDAGWSHGDVADAALAVDEAVQNAIDHGSVPRAPVEVVVDVCEDGAEITVRDRGRPGASVPDGPPRRPDASSVRGRGRAIMRDLADEVDWRERDGGTEVRLRLTPGDGDAGG